MKKKKKQTLFFTAPMVIISPVRDLDHGRTKQGNSDDGLLTCKRLGLEVQGVRCEREREAGSIFSFCQPLLHACVNEKTH